MTYNMLLYVYLFFITLNSPGAISNAVEFETVTINGVTWTAENIKIKISEKNCFDAPNCKDFFYTWEEAKHIDNQLKEWRLPTREDWRNLERHYGSKASDEYSAFIYVGDKVKSALHIKDFPGVVSENKISYSGEKISYWSVSSAKSVDNPNLRSIFIRVFYSSKDERSNKIYQCIVDEDVDYRCSIRLIKEH